MEYFHAENKEINLEMTDDEASNTDAMNYAKGIMGKSCMPKNITPSWLITTVREVIATVEEDLNPSNFKFENTLEGAKWNSDIIKKYNYDFEEAVANENNSILTPGSEFRNVENIEKVWKYRENWKKIESILLNGCIYPLKEEQPGHIRKQDLEAMVERGNHKSALTPDHKIVLEKIQKKEVSQGLPSRLQLNAS